MYQPQSFSLLHIFHLLTTEKLDLYFLLLDKIIREDISFKTAAIILRSMIILILHYWGTITPMAVMVLEMKLITGKDIGTTEI